MSELQEAKCVRRSELRSRSTSPCSASSDEVKDQWRRKLHLAYKDGISEQLTHDTHRPDGTPSEFLGDPSEEAYEFQLFSQKSRPSAVSTPQPLKVQLRSPSPEVKEPGFIRPARSQDFYFTGAVTPEAQKRFRSVAIEGERPGSHLRWRLTTLTLPSYKKVNADSNLLETAQAGKRKRPGKKRRIAVRTETQARKRREEVVQIAEAEKAAVLLEKRSRRNREKKLKRREKARSQKKNEVTASEVVE
ncbi:MAG: hypothetical protein L6R38_003560 [Xanthoria sp. 2 TBL-2021]|nr:MAG: hypothetical protein L6R38_003560 [Xanthoria sp. 2 TBL-2021]